MGTLTPLAESVAVKLTHWEAVDGSRYPWARASVADEIREWMEEVDHADVLASAGEKVMPLMLTGETRCGKTSTLAAVALHYKVPAFRMSISSIIGGYMGDTTKALKSSLDEAAAAPCGLWVLDEVDGIFQQRTDDGQGANKERNAALAVALSTIENLPPHVMLVATTNEPKIVDRAMLARFRRVDFPRWDELSPVERRKFAKSHGCELAGDAESYAEVVQRARSARVRQIISAAARKA
jgi:SpoVK/Ycf46/Vps4 family AAA+-type ATPase